MSQGTEKKASTQQRVAWKQRIIGALRDLVILTLIVSVVGWWQNRDLPARGTPMPEFSFATIDHQVVSNESLKGKATMMVVWAPWCGVCKFESPNVSRVHRWMGERANVVSLAIGYRDYASITGFVRDHRVDYPVLVGNEDIEEALKIQRLPTVFFFDEQGEVTFRTSGYTTTLGLLVRLWLS